MFFYRRYTFKWLVFQPVMLVFGGVKFIKPVGNLLVSCTIPMVQMKLSLNRQRMGVAWSEMIAMA